MQKILLENIIHNKKKLLRKKFENFELSKTKGEDNRKHH